MFTNVEGRFLSILESTISAMQIEEDGAVRAWETNATISPPAS